MKRIWGRMLLALLLSAALLFSGCSGEFEQLLSLPIAETAPAASAVEETAPPVAQDGEYSSKAEVGLYLYLYGKLPGNYITKDEAAELGWKNSAGNLWEVAPGKSIGGDRFGNYEGLLPENKQYRECDIDFDGGYRNARRIVYSDDGYIYYTEDHYETFEQLYP